MMAHHTGIDPDAIPVIRRAVSWHVDNLRSEIATTDAVVKALDEAGFVVMRADNIDGAISALEDTGQFNAAERIARVTRPIDATTRFNNDREGDRT